MKKYLPVISLVLLISTHYFGQDSPAKTVKIKGTVVAEYSELVHACYHVCGLTLIVQLDSPAPDKFVAVMVEYADGQEKLADGAPARLTKRAARWEFEGTMAQPVDERIRIDKYMHTVDPAGKDISAAAGIPLWKILDNAAPVQLPYGELLKMYRVKAGQFKPID